MACWPPAARPDSRIRGENNRVPHLKNATCGKNEEKSAKGPAKVWAYGRSWRRKRSRRGPAVGVVPELEAPEEVLAGAGAEAPKLLEGPADHAAYAGPPARVRAQRAAPRPRQRA